MEAIQGWVELSTTGIVNSLFNILVDLADLGGNVSALLGLL